MFSFKTVIVLPCIFSILFIATQSEDSCQKDNIDCSESTDHGIKLIDEELNNYQQDDPRLIHIIKEKYLEPPKKKSLNISRNLDHFLLQGQFGQPLEVDKIYKNKKRNGFFVEAGAFDGEKFSNTLYFELKRNWTGLLIEPDPKSYQMLNTKNRNAFAFPGCLSTKTHPEVVTFNSAGLMGGIVNKEKEEAMKHVFKLVGENLIKIQCFPFYSIIMALGNPVIDLLTLDIEGAEFPVLKTIPFDRVDIRVLVIEMNHAGEIFNGTEKEIEEFLEEKGYEFHKKVYIDSIFVKKKKKKSKKNIL